MLDYQAHEEEVKDKVTAITCSIILIIIFVVACIITFVQWMS